MKKAAVIIFAVAILGLMTLYKDRGGSASTMAPSSSRTAGTSAAMMSAPSGGYKDGTYTGDAVGMPYGIVQMAVVINGGKISDVRFLQMPGDQGYSRYVTSAAEPLLKQTTLSAQSANIDFVSGATSTSTAYQQSLQSALDQAASGTGSQNSSTPAASQGMPQNSASGSNSYPNSYEQ